MDGEPETTKRVCPQDYYDPSIAFGLPPLGLDWMGSAALVGTARVAVRQSKPPKAWIGTPAEENFELLALKEPTVLFTGTAREARHHTYNIRFPRKR